MLEDHYNVCRLYQFVKNNVRISVNHFVAINACFIGYTDNTLFVIKCCYQAVDWFKANKTFKNAYRLFL